MAIPIIRGAEVFEHEAATVLKVLPMIKAHDMKVVIPINDSIDRVQPKLGQRRISLPMSQKVIVANAPIEPPAIMEKRGPHRSTIAPGITLNIPATKNEVEM